MVMIKLLRRFLVLAALMFWQGGFTFYAAVVVPVGTQVLGSPLDQGLITRHVTTYLNLAGAFALLPLAWDALAALGRSPWARRVVWLSWAGMALTLILLVWLHGRLEDLLHPETQRILDRPIFRITHRGYLWISTVQWMFGVAYAAAMLLGWRQEDRQKG
jgi:hypothetical protein